MDSALASTGDLWRVTMEHSPVGMALLRPDGVFLAANRAFCDLLGYDAETITSQTYASSMHPDDLAASRVSLAQMLAGEIDSFRAVNRWVRADGSLLRGDLSVAVLRDDLGAPIHVIVQVVDLSVSRTLEMQLDAAQLDLQSAQAQAKAVFEAAGVGLVLMDGDGNALTMNQRQKDFMALAFPEGFGPGREGALFTADQSRRLTREELASSRAPSEGHLQDALMWVGQDPRTRRALSVTTRPVRLPSGEVVGTAAASLDVTDLVVARKVKDDFVAASSRELRTPLSAILASLELLEGVDDLDGHAQARVAAVRRNAWRLSRLVADLLYAARSGAGAPALDPHEVDLAPLLREAVTAAEVDAKPRQVTVRQRGPGSLVAMVDGLRLRHAMDNLLAHAVVSCRRGGRVDMVLEEDGDAVEVTLRHDDDGVDTARARADHLFLEPEAFFEPTSGQGLGLSIVRTIVEGHGGEISVDTAPGDATTVRVILPRQGWRTNRAD